jgi:hypothetical protein
VRAAHRQYSTHERGNKKLHICILLLFLIFFSMYFPFNGFFLDYFYFTISTILTIMVDTAVPVIIIIVSNILVFVKLIKNLNKLTRSTLRSSLRNGEEIRLNQLSIPSPNNQSAQFTNNLIRNGSSSSPDQMLKRRKRELKKTAFTLFAVSFEFCLFNLPFATYLIITLIMERLDITVTAKLEDFGKFSFLLNLLNQSTNFLLYFVHMASFRKEIFRFVELFFKFLICRN